MQRRTFYELLMVDPRADSDVIAVVYRHLAKRYHPDRDASPDAKARMIELNEAYAVLSDAERRLRYDESIGVGSAPERASPGPAAAQPAAAYGEAGPPPATPPPSGSVLTFGRYRGWTLGQVKRYDRDYLEWLSRTPTGRLYRQELQELLRGRG